MKIRFSYFIYISLVVLAGCSVGTSSPAMIGKPAPLVQLYKIDGDQFTLDEYEGQPVVLLFWAQWCSRSRSFIEDLRDAAPALKSKGIAILAVDIDKQEKFADLQAMIRDRQLGSFDHAFSGNDIYDQAFIAFGSGEVPTVFILNSSHRIVAQGSSFDVVAEKFHL
jgi:peroxiredoxin